MRPALALAFAILVLFSLGLAASPVSAAPDDACKLLTEAQIKAALGVAVTPGKHTTETYTKTCTWNTSGGTSADPKFMTLDLHSSANFESGKQMASAMKSFGEKDAPGVGDDAYFTEMNGGSITSLLVKKGGIAFKMAIYGGSDAAKKEAAALALARQVASQL